MWSRRDFGSAIVVIAGGNALPASTVQADPLDLSAIPLSAHEHAMRLAIEAARGNLAYPFGDWLSSTRSGSREHLNKRMKA